MRTVGTLFLTTFILVSSGCRTSAPTVKQLDESSARDLVAVRLKTESYKIQVDNISELLGRSLKDYKSSSAVNDREATLKRLLATGLVVQTVEMMSYPKVSGKFTSEKEYVGARTVYDLESVPNSNVFTGDSYRTAGVSGGWKVEGRIEPDGSMKLLTGGLAEEHVKYVEEGSAAYLDFEGGSSYGRYKGIATGKRVEVRWYQYSWSSDFQKQLTHTKGRTYVTAGDFEVGNVTGLRLVTDTEAKAEFSWRTSLNDVGRVFLGSRASNGTSGVTFGKKPDGTWFVDQ